MIGLSRIGLQGMKAPRAPPELASRNATLDVGVADLGLSARLADAFELVGVADDVNRTDAPILEVERGRPD